MSIKRDGNVLPVDDVATKRFHSDLARPSTATPIWWIPNETLLHIVEIGHTLQLMDSSLNSEPSLPFTMSHVSRTFRMLTTSQPSLWSTFSFSSPHQMGVLKQHLGRSKSSLLDIRINLATFMFQYGKSEQDALDVLDLVMDHYNRWQSFKISCNVVAARYFTSFLQGHTIPVLENMYLRLHDIDGNHSIHPPIAGDCLPSLRSARLDCLGPHSFSVPPAALQELILDNVPFSMMRQMTLCRFRDFINAMPSLQRLFLHLCVINNIELTNVGAPIHAPSLLALVLYTEYAGVGFLAHLFAIMSAPHLESLSLAYLEDNDFKDVDVNLLPKCPSIRTLTLKRSTFGQTSTLHCLFAIFPSITHFVMDSYTDTCLALQCLSEPRSESAQSLPWPDLHTCSYCASISNDDIVEMLGMVLGRRKGGQPLKRLCLPQHVVFVLNSHIPELQQVVAVEEVVLDDWPSDDRF